MGSEKQAINNNMLQAAYPLLKPESYHLAGMAGPAAIIAAVYLIMFFLSFGDSIITGSKHTQICPVYYIWHIAASVFVHFMITI